jgi:protein-S-isoprenylcysteine O-methyltransferase Ste14
MSAQDWVRNTRGEWYVLAQGALVFLVLLAPIIDGKAPFTSAQGVTATTVLGAVLCAIGLAFVALGGRSLGRNATAFARPKDDAQLVETGVYSIVRHPIYTGLSLIALGYSLLWTSLAALAAAIALFIILDVKARREERWLNEMFDGYGRYKARVRRLIPFIY